MVPKKKTMSTVIELALLLVWAQGNNWCETQESSNKLSERGQREVQTRTSERKEGEGKDWERQGGRSKGKHSSTNRLVHE